MTTEDNEPLFYAKGGAVFQRPNKGQMGFKVCDCNEFVDGAAELIADSLNLVHEMSGVTVGCSAEAPKWVARAFKIMREE